MKSNIKILCLSSNEEDATILNNKQSTWIMSFPKINFIIAWNPDSSINNENTKNSKIKNVNFWLEKIKELKGVDGILAFSQNTLIQHSIFLILDSNNNNSPYGLNFDEIPKFSIVISQSQR